MTRAPALQMETLEPREVPARVAYGLVSGNRLFQFNPENPQSIARVVVLTGIANGNTLVGMDFAPGGTLYMVATTSAPANTFQLYTVNTTTGVATTVGTPKTVPGGSSVFGTTSYGVDVNPVSGLIQMTTNLDSDANNTGRLNNFTIDPANGGAITVLPDLVFPPQTEPEAAIAFTNNVPGATTTTLFGIVTRPNPNQLVINGSAGNPNENLVVVGSLGFESPAVAIDLAPDNTAFAVLNVNGVYGVYTVNLGTGAATPVSTGVNQIGNGTTPIIDVAIDPNTGGSPPAPSATVFTAGGSAGAQVQSFSASGSQVQPSTAFTAFPGFPVDARATSADVDGDGTPDIIAVTGPGAPVRLTVINGGNGATLVSPFDPFGGNFLGGGFVSAADIDGDGRAEIVVSPDEGGGPRAVIFNLSAGASTLTQRASFLGIDDPDFRGGARPALGDVNGDGTPDLAVAAGFLGGPRVALFNGTTLLSGNLSRLVGDFFAFPGSDAFDLRNGAFVSAGDINGDGKADLIFGGGPGGAPRVFILSGQLISAGDVNGAYNAPVANFFVNGNTGDRGGVRVANANVDGDARADLVVGSGEGSPARVRVYLGANFSGSNEPTAVQEISIFGGVALAGGVYVG